MRHPNRLLNLNTVSLKHSRRQLTKNGIALPSIEVLEVRQLLSGVSGAVGSDVETDAESGSADELRISEFVSIEYLGNIAVPRIPFSASAYSKGEHFGYSNGAFTYIPERDSFLLSGHVNGQLVAEISNPGPGGTAELLHGFVDVTGGALAAQTQRFGSPVQIQSLLSYDGRVIVSTEQYYNVQGRVIETHGSFNPDLDAPDFDGWWGVGNWTGQATGYYMTRIPEEFVTDGHDLLTGGSITWRAGSSPGPAAILVDPSQAAPGMRLEDHTMLRYSLKTVGREIDYSDPASKGVPLHDGGVEGWLGHNNVGGVAVLGDQLVYFGRQSLGYDFYGASTDYSTLTGLSDPYDGKGYKSGPYQAELWVYDLNDVLSGGNGVRRIAFPWALSPNGHADIRGAYLDGDTLYVTEASAMWYGQQPVPVIHVLKLRDTRPDPNSPPTLTIGTTTITAGEGSPIANSGTVTDADPDDVISLTASSGTVVRTGENWRWVATADDGPSSLTVTITATDLVGASTSVSFDVTSLNVDPTVTDDLFRVSEDDAGQILNPLINDSDPAGFSDPLRITSLTPLVTPVGNVSLHLGRVLYDPAGRFESLAEGVTHTERLAYTIADDDGGTAEGLIEIVVEGANDSPEAVGELADLEIDQNSTVQEISLAELFHDVDEGDVLTLTATAADGSLIDTVVEGSTLLLAPNLNQAGVTEVTVTATDESGASASVSFQVTVHSPITILQALKERVIQPVDLNEIDVRTGDRLLRSLSLIESELLKSAVNLNATRGKTTAAMKQIEAAARQGDLTDEYASELETGLRRIATILQIELNGAVANAGSSSAGNGKASR